MKFCGTHHLIKSWTHPNSCYLGWLICHVKKLSLNYVALNGRTKTLKFSLLLSMFHAYLPLMILV